MSFCFKEQPEIYNGSLMDEKQAKEKKKTNLTSFQVFLALFLLGNIIVYTEIVAGRTTTIKKIALKKWQNIV